MSLMQFSLYKSFRFAGNLGHQEAYVFLCPSMSMRRHTHRHRWTSMDITDIVRLGKTV
jgi:hypothetical protein